MNRLIASFLLLTIFIGCGPKVKIKPDAPPTPKTIALLPAERGTEVSRERIELIENAVRNELKGRGFIVLEHGVIERACGGEGCPRRNTLASLYNLDGIATLRIDTAAKTNFLAGFVNVLTGTLALISPDGTEIASVEHTETERGGLIFNSGQILEGIKSQVAETSEDSFGKLAENFAATAVRVLPQPATGGTNQQSFASQGSPAVSAVTFSPYRRSAYKICARGTPDLSGSLISRFGRSTLRETSKGDYCGVFTLRSNSATRTAKSVEIRNPFGQSAQRELSSSFPETCDFTDIAVSASNGGRTLTLVCSKESANKSAPQCKQQLAQCADTRLVVYGASIESGPYRKLGEFRGLTWTSKSPFPPLVEIISLDKTGYTSPPLRLRSEATQIASTTTERDS